MALAGPIAHAILALYFPGTVIGDLRPMSGSTAAFDYDLPQALIAQQPAARRDASRLMVLEGDATQHRRFSDLPQLLESGDLLVLNETRVVRARLLGRRAGGGRAELLLAAPGGVDPLRRERRCAGSR